MIWMRFYPLSYNVNMAAPTMKTWQWIAATCIAATMMISYLHGFIYTRAEAKVLQAKVDKLAEVHREDIRGIHQELKDLNQWLRENVRRPNR